MNAPGEGHNLRSVASRYLRYGHTHSASSEAGDTAGDAHKTEQHQKAEQPTGGGTPVHMPGEVETRRDPKLVLGRRRLQRSTEKGHPEGNGGLSSVPPTKVPSTVMRGIGPRASSRKTSSVVTTTQRAQQLISRARNRLQKERVQKEKVVRQAAKKLASSSGLSSSAAPVVTGPPGEGGGITEPPDNSSVPPPSMELDEDEVGEASEVEEEGEGQPKKVKIKLPDNKTPSELMK